jgi:hypothetical protein
VANAVARHVAVSTAPKSIPAAFKTAGCTKMMYAIVKNVVRPARASVRTVVPLVFRWKRTRGGGARYVLLGSERRERLVAEHVETREHADSRRRAPPVSRTPAMCSPGNSFHGISSA